MKIRDDESTLSVAHNMLERIEQTEAEDNQSTGMLIDELKGNMEAEQMDNKKNRHLKKNSSSKTAGPPTKMISKVLKNIKRRQESKKIKRDLDDLSTQIRAVIKKREEDIADKQRKSRKSLWEKLEEEMVYKGKSLDNYQAVLTSRKFAKMTTPRLTILKVAGNYGFEHPDD